MTSQTPGRPRTKLGLVPSGARPDPRETRGCGRHAERSRPGHCPPPRREFSAAPPRTPIPNLTAGACESAKASPERTGTGRGPALGAESGALPAGQPRPCPPRGATLHLQGGGGRDPLHEAHPYTGPLGGGRAPRPGNAAEAGEPRRSWVPCPRERRWRRAAGVRPSRLRDLRQRSVEVGGRADSLEGERHLR